MLNQCPAKAEIVEAADYFNLDNKEQVINLIVARASRA